jgi:hypothetical protein
MKRYISIIALMLLTGWLSAQSPTRIFVPGTKCSFDRKEGFNLAKRFNGFENEKEKAAVMVSVLNNSLEANKKAFSREEMKKRGMTFVSYSEPELNGLKTVLYEFTQLNREIIYRKYILIFGDSSKTFMINSGAPDSIKSLCETVKAITLSVMYEPEAKEDLFNGVDFTLDADVVGFKPAKYSMGGLVLTRDGLATTASDDQAAFLVGPSVKKVNSIDKVDFALRKIKAISGLDSLLSYKVDSLIVDNLRGVEITGKAINKKKEEMVVYEVLLFVNENSYYIMLGHATARFDVNLNHFRTLAKSFKRK